MAFLPGSRSHGSYNEAMLDAGHDSDISLMSVSFPEDGDSEFMSVADESIPDDEQPSPSATWQPRFLDQESLEQPATKEYWASEAERLVRSYRWAYEDVHGTLAHHRRVRRVHEDLEAAFQRSLSLTASSLEPLALPPNTLPSNSCAAAFDASAVRHWPSLIPGLQQGHRHEDLPVPLTAEHLEICLVGTCLGVALGSATMHARSIMPRLRFFPIILAMWAAPTSARILSNLHIEAQSRDSTLMVTAAHCIHRLWTEVHGAAAKFCRLPLRVFLATMSGGVRGVAVEAVKSGSAIGPDAFEALYDLDSDVEVPPDLLCPITRQLFVRPVLLQGAPFEEDALRAWLARNPRHPLFTDVPAFPWQIQDGAEELRDLCKKYAVWASDNV